MESLFFEISLITRTMYVYFHSPILNLFHSYAENRINDASG